MAEENNVSVFPTAEGAEPSVANRKVKVSIEFTFDPVDEYGIELDGEYIDHVVDVVKDMVHGENDFPSETAKLTLLNLDDEILAEAEFDLDAEDEDDGD